MPSETHQNPYGDRLSFVKIFMAEQGITQKEIATLCGKSNCAVSHMFAVADDMRLSEIEKIFQSRGCQLKLSITKDPFEDVDKYTLAKSDFLPINGELVEPRLYFIMLAMKRYDVNRERLAALLGIRPSTIRYWLFLANDTYMSNIMDVARVLGCHLKIKIVNMRQDEEENNLAKDPAEEETRMIVETNSVKISRLKAD